MKLSWGKIRIEAIASLGVIAFALSAFSVFSVALRAYSADPTPTPEPTQTLLVADGCTDAVTAYSAASNGDVSPLPPTPTGLAEPNSVAIDVSGNIYVTNRCGGLATITIYAKGSNGDAAPIATIGGRNTGLNSPIGIAMDSSGKIYVTDDGPGGGSPGSVFVYAAGSNGNVTPIATIGGSNIDLEFPYGIALDSSGKIYVAGFDLNDSPGVFVYAALGSSTGLLNEPPIATISGSNTGLEFPYGIALDSTGKIYVADLDADSVLVYAAQPIPTPAPLPSLGSSTGPLNEAPIATISGSNTGLEEPYGIAVDSSSKIYVADAGVGVLVYAAGSNGNVAPVATISGGSTGLESPYGIAVDSSSKIYVADPGAVGVLVYAAGSSGNVAPVTTIRTSVTTGLIFPRGIAVDSSGKIYVAVDVLNESPGVLVYSAGSNGNGNAVPIATIRGSKTDLKSPYGIAVDSSGKIFVTDPVAVGVFVYAALGSSTGLLNEAPIATIGGSKTDLKSPHGIAADSSGKIYVVDPGFPFASPPVLPSVLVYAAGSNGNVAPIATISGSKTALKSPAGIAVDSKGKIYVADDGHYHEGPGSVFVYAAGSKGNTAPIAAISGSNTGLHGPEGIALDSKGKIYAVDLGNPFASPPIPPSVLVYAAGSNGNIAAVATISGPNTELFEPLFLALTTPATTLSAAPSMINFGNVDATGTSKPKKVTLTNKGTAAAQILMVTATEPFKIAGGVNTCSGETKKTCSFEVEFAPPTEEHVTGGSIDVTYNGSSPVMSLSGTGIAVTLTAPSKETFPPVAAGTTGNPKTFAVSNPATVSVDLGTTIIGGNDPGAFTIAANTCIGKLAPKRGCKIAIEFTPPPGATRAQSATVGFGYTYGANYGSVSVPLSGTVR